MDTSDLPAKTEEWGRRGWTMDFQDTNIMETTCNSKPRGKIESVAFGWIDIDIYVLTSTLFEINWIFLFFYFDKMDVGFLYETDMNVTWKKMCFSRGYYSFDQGTCYKSTSYFLKSYGSVFFGFVTFTGKQNIFRHWKTDTSRRGMVEHFKEDPWRVTAKWLTVLPWTSAEQ